MSGLFYCVNMQMRNLFFLLFLLLLLHLLPVCLCLMFLFLCFLRPLSFCRLSARAFHHGLGSLLARRLQDGFDAQIVNVVRSHADIDRRPETSVCGLARIVAVPSPRII